MPDRVRAVAKDWFAEGNWRESVLSNQPGGLDRVSCDRRGKQVWADGLDFATSELLDAKFVASAGRSPFVAGGQVPDFIQAKIDAKIGDEFARYSAVIGDSGNPLRGLRVITNEPGAVPYFKAMMEKYGVPGVATLGN
ncbi:restriction endonuclease fold toxin-2 domain-containing protein [Isoptericola jiangsuensis]|uniref:restriction endonuclease fold toxin-2 domain-containing protein n=1 Tax=Isoptericola jiangsuensis TaxID=548579 RepID=UPI003AB01A34